MERGPNVGARFSASPPTSTSARRNLGQSQMVVHRSHKAERAEANLTVWINCRSQFRFIEPTSNPRNLLSHTAEIGLSWEHTYT